MFEIHIASSIDEKRLDLINYKIIGSYEFVGRTRDNNGIKGYTKSIINNKINEPNTISISQVGTITAQLRTNLWYASQNIFKLIPKNNESRLISLFLVGVIDLMLSKKYSPGYSNYPTLTSLNNDYIKLPIKNNKIDFNFMETIVAELEAQRVAELEAYLKMTGLDDYELTEEEKKVINSFDDIKWKEYKFDDVFNHINQGKRLKKSDQVSGNIPFIMSGITNNGVANYISNPIIMFPKNSVTIDIFGNTFYRNYPFSAGDDTGVYWTDKYNLDLKQMLYLTATMRRALKGKYSYGNKLRSSKSYNILMKLPVNSEDKIDFEFMQIFISAIQKLVIKNVVEYKDKLIDKTKDVISNN